MHSSVNNNQQCHWHGFKAIAELERAAVQAIMHSATQSISQRGAFRIVLAGGATPRRVYELLREQSANWAAWHVYFGDERCLPVDHAERNSVMAAQAWLNHVDIPASQIYIISAETGAEHAAQQYAHTLQGIGMFDLVLLGLGEDGHTASLFPGHEWGTASGASEVIAVLDAPKPPPHRVSLSAHRLSLAREVIFLVTGEGKRQAVNDWRNGAAIPAAAIVPKNGVDVYVEEGLLKI